MATNLSFNQPVPSTSFQTPICQKNQSITTFISPEDIRGLPKAGERTNKQRVRVKQTSIIATDTPEKNRILNKTNNKTILSKVKRKLCISPKKPNGSLINKNNSPKKSEKLKQLKRSKGNLNDSILVLNDSSDDSYETYCEKENNEVMEENAFRQEIEAIDSDQNLEGKYVLVKFVSKKSCKYYVALVLNEKLKVKFMRKWSSKNIFVKDCFIWPLVDDISVIKRTDIRHILPTPKEDRRGRLTFQISFRGYDVQ